MTKQRKRFLFNGRYLTVMVIFTLGFVVLAWRLFDLMVLQNKFLTEQGDARSIRLFNVPAYRGMITDRNGEPLAVSTPVTAVWANPKDVELADPNLKEIARLLNLDYDKLYATLAKNSKREFIYLKRGVRPDIINALDSLGVKGIYNLREFRRYYPEGEATSQLIGFTNIDDRGQEGVELAFDNWLSGVPGKKRVLKDRLGHIIANVELLAMPKPGHDIALSIDRRVQYIVYRELKKAVQQLDALSGSAVVLDSQTGEVLAMANYPSFNPNIRYRVRNEYFRNRAVTDVFEPGSVIKPFSIASALLSGKFRPYSIINTYPSRIHFGKNVISDERSYGKLSVTEILMHSSNVGVTRLVLASDPGYYLNLLKRAGFGQITGSGFPGESAGVYQPRQLLQPFVLATVAFGYGLSVTTLQIAQAFSIFANNGEQPAVTLIKRTEPAEKRHVLPPVVAQQMLRMLEQVALKGTGRNAQVLGYRVAGKTGTSRVAGPEGYDKDKHIATFAGIVPVGNPRLVLALTINQPRNGKYYASQTTAPLFRSITTDILRVLNITPDNIA